MNEELWKFIKFNISVVITSALDIFTYLFLIYRVFDGIISVPLPDNAVLSLLGIKYRGYLFAYLISTCVGYIAAYLINRKITFHSNINPVYSSVMYLILALFNILISSYIGGVFGSFLEINNMSNPITEAASKFIIINIPTLWTYPLERYVIQINKKEKAVKYIATDLDGTLLDTEKLLNRNIFSLSGGEKQLMAITSVMTMDNQVYLFDEPSASLDHHSIGLLKKCIAELKRKGKIVIIAEHRLYYLKEIMDYLAVLKEGKLEMISVEDLDHDKICRLKETYALRSFEEIRKEELLSDNPCYQIQMLNKTKNGEKDKNILKCKNFAQSFKNTKIMDIGEIGFSEGIYFIGNC